MKRGMPPLPTAFAGDLSVVERGVEEDEEETVDMEAVLRFPLLPMFVLRGGGALDKEDEAERRKLSSSDLARETTASKRPW